jgi:pimeloyl-ACP methyl ester carboxylesterase
MDDQQVSKDVTAHIALVDIGQDRLINTLKLTTQDAAKPKRTLVMAHGYGAGLGFFYRNYPALGKLEDFQVYSVDWLGMANSSRPKFPTFSYASSEEKKSELTEAFFVDSLEAWRKAHDIPKMTLMGHSLGGYLCTGYALKYPDNVDKLILVSPAGVPEPPPEANNQRKGALISIFRQLWLWNVTPMSVLRAAGPFGSHLLRQYTSRRYLLLLFMEIPFFFPKK